MYFKGFKLKIYIYIILVIILIFLSSLLFIGDFVYRTGTKVFCGVHEYHKKNTPHNITVPGEGNGPFRGDNWNKWINVDLSEWTIKNISYELVYIDNYNKSISLEAWWIPSLYQDNLKTVIVIHGLNTNRQDFNVLLPSVFLAKAGFNVLSIDLRDHGGSTCEDSRHSAGQKEYQDIITAIKWLNKEKNIPNNKMGIHGISGGAIATLIAATKVDDIKAFSLDSPIFDFNKAAKDEVVWQGYPGFFWSLAYLAGRIRGVDLNKITPMNGIDSLNDRYLQIFHGTNDTRVSFSNSVEMYNYAKSKNINVKFHKFVNADHTEGILIDPIRYYKELNSFFINSLN